MLIVMKEREVKEKLKIKFKLPEWVIKIELNERELISQSDCELSEIQIQQFMETLSDSTEVNK